MDKPTAERDCLPCNECCEGWLEFKVEGASASLGCRCPHSTRAGCTNYENRPVAPCRTFLCGWRTRGSPYPDWMRPDMSKVIVLFGRRTWRGLPVDIGVPVGQAIPERALEWLKRFAEVYNRPLLWSEQIVKDGVFTGKQRVAAHGPPEFQQEMNERVRRNEKMW